MHQNDISPNKTVSFYKNQEDLSPVKEKKFYETERDQQNNLNLDKSPSIIDIPMVKSKQKWGSLANNSVVYDQNDN